MAEAIQENTQTATETPVVESEANTPAGDANKDDASNQETVTQNETAESVVEVELTDGTVRNLTAEEVANMFDLEDKYKNLQTEYGRMSNEVGNLRKQTTQNPDKPIVPVQQNQPITDFKIPEITEDDLADPAKLQEKWATALESVISKVDSTTKQFHQDMIIQSKAEKTINSHPVLSKMNPKQAVAIFDSAVAMANMANEEGLAKIADYEQAVDYFFSSIGNNKVDTQTESVSQATRNLVKKIRSTGGDTVPLVSSQNQYSGNVAEYLSKSDTERVEYMKTLKPARQRELAEQLAAQNSS